MIHIYRLLLRGKPPQLFRNRIFVLVVSSLTTFLCLLILTSTVAGTPRLSFRLQFVATLPKTFPSWIFNPSNTRLRKHPHNAEIIHQM
jgi:hypothetical protein